MLLFPNPPIFVPDEEDEGNNVLPDQPGGGATFGLLATEDDDKFEVKDGLLTGVLIGGGAIVRLPLSEEDVNVLVLEVLNTLFAVFVVPVCEGVIVVGVILCAGVETEVESKSSHDITSNTFPPTGISLATCCPPALAEPTSVAKSTSPEGVRPETLSLPPPPEDPAT